MITQRTRERLSAQLKANGTLGAIKKATSVTAKATDNPQSKAVARALRNQRQPVGPRWLPSSDQMPVLP